MKILIGTKNQHKLAEMTRIMVAFFQDKNIELEIVSLNYFPKVKEPLENGTTFLENAQIKAKYYYDIFQIPTLADDSGLEVESLNNEPGIYSARYASNTKGNSTDEANREKLLYRMKDITSRNANFVCAMTLYDGKVFISAIGITSGKILNQEIGENGFGYDSLFYSDELNKPLGIASNDEKDAISHRGKALRSLLNKI